VTTGGCKYCLRQLRGQLPDDGTLGGEC